MRYSLSELKIVNQQMKDGAFARDPKERPQADLPDYGDYQAASPSGGAAIY